MRIIAGKCRGKKLRKVRAAVVRPTADRIRESLFAIIGDEVVDARVCDLYAGTGALGIEALSRGAQRVCFVERDPAAVRLIRENLQSCRLEDRADVIRWNIARGLDCLRLCAHPLDMVFMDPPYERQLAAPALFGLHAGNHLASGALIVVEHALSEKMPEIAWASRFDQRKYGKTLVSFFRCL